MVSGVAALTPGKAGFLAAAAIVGWGWLSVHCQALSLTAPAGLSFRWHWAGKAVQAALSAILAAGAWMLL
ncbi:MAG: sporulation protein, partial [Oscillospiraceae bacterium]|nr:sporulation protein [Oscillospiraceae bacterium]